MGSRFLTLLLMLPAILPAQVTGRLTGSVVDATGAAVPDATVNVLLTGGTSPVLSAKTTNEGLFHLIGVRPEVYDISIEAKGFVTTTIRGVKVDPSRETVVPQVTLELPSVTTKVDVTADVQNVQTANAEITTSITHEQVDRLPVLDRYALGLVTTQAGVAVGRSNTTINGLRTTYSSVTLDGINVQDNFLRENGLDYIPNLLQLDQVAEVTLSTSNSNASMGGGASQVSIVTPSGGNELHGKAIWYNRNNKLAAADWFDNKDGNPKAFLNQNILGGSLGGPIRKDKLFFYGNYEGLRLRQKSSQDRTILTADARNGTFTYRDAGSLQKVNVLQVVGLQIDPVVQGILAKVPGPAKINNLRLGDRLNTGGYSFQARDNRTRDNVTAKLDYVLSTKHVFSGSYLWNRDMLDRNDAENDYSIVPKVVNDNHIKLFNAAWRWNPRPSITNELRGGANLAPGDFKTTETFGPYLLDGFLFDNPVNLFQPQGRSTNTYSVQDNASYVHGKHSFQFGFQTQMVRVAPYNAAGVLPTYGIGVGAGNRGLTARELPGAAATDRTFANSLLASLAGYIESYDQVFNVTGRTSGFVPGAIDRRHFIYNNYAGYVQDAWKILPRLTLTLGLRYDYYGVVDERDGLALLPVIENNNPIQTLLSNAAFNFAGRGTSRPFYNKDLNNFAPNIGVAWDMFGDGKTALRGGYSIHYVDDNTIATVQNNVLNTNSGLQSESFLAGLSGRVSGGLPKVQVPEYKVPRTQEDNHNINFRAAMGMPDPGLRTPYVQAWTFGVQHQLKGVLVEVRYVGNHATKSLRGFDYNQVIIKENGFLDDFLKAQKNGYLTLAMGLGFNPAYNANIPGSQPLPVFNRLVKSGSLNLAPYQNLIQQGQVAELAYQYQINDLNGRVQFFRNPVALGTNMITNYSNSTYNSLQVDVRRRTRSGFEWQANYTFSKVLSDALGDNQVRFEPFLDINNPKIERAPAPFDIRHNIKANGAYYLPLGDGHRLNYRPLRRVLTGWATNAIFSWQSGTPFSILSGRGTLNRSSRSGGNTAITTLTKSQLDQVIGFRMTGDGPYFADPSVIGADGRAVAGDGKPPFNGQVFFNPVAGTIGTLQRRMFSGPWVFGLDLGLAKNTKITERQSIEFRMEASNALNHPAFFAGDETTDSSSFRINSPTFGRIVSTFTTRRVVQLGLIYRF